MSNLESIKKDLLSLRGAEVKIFGQDCTLTKCYDDLTIDSVVVVEALKPFEYCYLNDMECEELLSDESLYSDKGSNNSYNWNSPLSNHINYNIYKDLVHGGFIYEIKFHRYGDVRGNYTNEVYCKFDDDYTFIDTLMECSNSFSVEVDGYDYYCTVDIFSELVSVWGKSCDFEVYAGDMEELKEMIKSEGV